MQTYETMAIPGASTRVPVLHGRVFNTRVHTLEYSKHSVLYQDNSTRVRLEQMRIPVCVDCSLDQKYDTTSHVYSRVVVPVVQ